MPHLAFTVLASLLVSVSMALVGNQSRRERLFVALYRWFCCLATVLVGSWAMYFIHG